jgi:hypothetical protein
MLIVNFLTGLIGCLVFLFIFWKRLKEDYASEIIFKLATYILTAMFISWLISIRFFLEGFLWFEFIGGIIGLGISFRLLKVRFYETLEAFVIASLPWVALTLLKSSVVDSSLSSFIAFIASLVMIFVYYFLDYHYKEFTWYKSGKIGFSGLTTLALIFVTRSLLALTGIHVLSFVSKFEGIISGAFAFICFILIYNLGRVTDK